MGHSIDPKRQDGPHAHCVVFDNQNKYVYVPDLGLDKIMIYKFNVQNGKLEHNDPSWHKIKAGSGPRHFVFHPTGRYAYLITELSSTIVAFDFDKNTGNLKEIQTISTLPKDLMDEVQHLTYISVHQAIFSTAQTVVTTASLVSA